MQIRIGTRGSKLALIQTNIVIKLIMNAIPDVKPIIVPIVTTGDKITDRNLYDIGGKALFLKEIEEELLANKIDIATHSLKDVPGILDKNLSIAATIQRDDPRDCFVSFNYKSIKELPIGATVGSSSVRRKVIMQKMRPDLKFVPFRGNIDTRLKKLRDSRIDATILSVCGLKRSNLFNSNYCYPIEINEMLPAAGQGVIAIEICKDNQEMKEICDKINHLPTWYITNAERSFVSYLNATCSTPVAAHAVFDKGKIYASYMLSDLDGNDIRYHQEIGEVESSSMLGVSAAKIMLNR